jgi:hypothetical protein
MPDNCKRFRRFLPFFYKTFSTAKASPFSRCRQTQSECGQTFLNLRKPPFGSYKKTTRPGGFRYSDESADSGL